MTRKKRWVLEYILGICYLLFESWKLKRGQIFKLMTIFKTFTNIKMLEKNILFFFSCNNNQMKFLIEWYF